MAPNNALAQPNKKKTPSNTVADVVTIESIKHSNEDDTAGTATTTILDEGIVQSRGHGSRSTVDVIHQEIQDFLHDNQTKQNWAYTESRSFFTVWTFLTRLPGPTYVDHHPGYLMIGMIYFPLVGTIIGIWISQFYNVAYITMGLPPIIAASISIASSFWLTGCFHEDGVRNVYVCVYAGLCVCVFVYYSVLR